ncbi:MAG: hypothetical protein NTZ05_05465 [Chloroflexi bacterium]|nr:hypothetical protein [Chloroflexota bacterium]
MPGVREVRCGVDPDRGHYCRHGDDGLEVGAARVGHRLAAPQSVKDEAWEHENAWDSGWSERDPGYEPPPPLPPPVPKRGEKSDLI